VYTVQDAAAFVRRSGLALAFPCDDLVLPSLWEDVVGTPELTVSTVNERGKRVLTEEMRRVWQLKNALGSERLACVGKFVRGRVTLVSLEALPALYALADREAELAPLERELVEALQEHGPQTAPELRALLGFAEAKRVGRALERLQRQIVVALAGEQAQEHGWDAGVFDLVARRYRESLRRLPGREDACAALATAVLGAAGRISAADLAAVLGIRRREAAAALDDVAVRLDEDGVVLWSTGA
jgi:hypothetical protein